MAQAEIFTSQARVYAFFYADFQWRVSTVMEYPYHVGRGRSEEATREEVMQGRGVKEAVADARRPFPCNEIGRRFCKHLPRSASVLPTQMFKVRKKMS